MHKLQTTLLLGLVATGGFLAASYTPPATAVSSRVDLELSDVVSIRVLDKTATTEIDSVDLELITTPTGAFTSDNFIVEASTSNPTGYKLYMSTDFQKGDPATYTTDLVNQEDDTYTIPTLGTSDVSLADFSQARGSYVNRWGYSLDNLTYDPVPAHDTTEEIGSSSTASAADRTNVYVALNANMDKISGLYKNTLVFSGVANPIQTAYSLHFLPGTPDAVTGLPEDQSASEISASHTFTIPSNVPERAGYDFTGYTDGTTTYQPGDSITVLGGEDYTGSATLTAMWELASYTITISNSNTTSGASSISIPYGGSNTVTVTPSSGYYLSSVSCPSGYTCSGYSTGTSATGMQTVTVTNNNTASGGTLSFTGTISKTLEQTCNEASTGSTFTYSDVQYIKLKTNSTGSTTACYTKTSQGSAGFNNAATLCPSGTGVPSQSEFQSLIDAYGSDGTIYNTTGWSGNYWSSTPKGSNDAYDLRVSSSNAYIGYLFRTYSRDVVCIVR